MKLKLLLLLICLALIVGVGFFLWGRITEAIGVASVAVAAAGVAQRVRMSDKAKSTIATLDTELSAIEETKEELSAIAMGIEDSEARYLENVKKMTPEEKKRLAKELFDN